MRKLYDKTIALQMRDTLIVRQNNCTTNAQLCVTRLQFTKHEPPLTLQTRSLVKKTGTPHTITTSFRFSPIG